MCSAQPGQVGVASSGPKQLEAQAVITEIKSSGPIICQSQLDPSSNTCPLGQCLPLPSLTFPVLNRGLKQCHLTWQLDLRRWIMQVNYLKTAESRKHHHMAAATNISHGPAHYGSK